MGHNGGPRPQYRRPVSHYGREGKWDEGPGPQYDEDRPPLRARTEGPDHSTAKPGRRYGPERRARTAVQTKTGFPLRAGGDPVRSSNILILEIKARQRRAKRNLNTKYLLNCCEKRSLKILGRNKGLSTRKRKDQQTASKGDLRPPA